MEQFIEVIVFLVAAGALSRLFRKGRKAQPGTATGREPPPEEEWEVDEHGEPVEAGERPVSLEDLIREELGFNLERRPRVRRPPPAPPEGASSPGQGLSSTARTGQPELPGVGGPPRSPRSARPLRAPGSVARAEPRAGPAVLPKRRDTAFGQPRSTGPAVAGRPDAGDGAPSLEERLIRERGEAVSLEVPRTPEAHGRFHERYDIPRPVTSHEEFHRRYVHAGPAAVRRRRTVRLPDSESWSPTQKAIIWADVLGPPRGLTL